MPRLTRLFILVTVLVAGLLPELSQADSKKDRPNIILILIDDLGYADLGCYGSKVNKTPHIDQLASESLLFTDFHSNGPMCTPTRAALLTGRYQNRFGRKFEAAISGKTDYDKGLPLDAYTIPEALKKAGYATGMFGKWHLGYQPPYIPTNQGFDEFRGLTSGDGDHHSHIDRSGRKDWWKNENIEMEKGYSVDLLTKHSVDFIKRHRNEPFFLYLPHLAIHFPWQGPDDKGYRVEGMGYHNLTKLGDLKDKNIGPQVKKMVEAVDGSVGRILDTLKELNLEENTIVIFTSDNGGYQTYEGGHHNISNNGVFRGQKTDVWEGGHRVPALIRWPGKIKPGSVTHETTMTFDIFPTLLDLTELSSTAGPDKMDGISLAPLLLEGENPPERTLFWRMRSLKAVRKGPWKLVITGPKEIALYNLDDDPGEKTDLSEKHPQILEQLQTELKDWETEMDQNG